MREGLHHYLLNLLIRLHTHRNPLLVFDISSCQQTWLRKGVWLVVWNMNVIFPFTGNVIIPTDELIFFRGVGQPPTSIGNTYIYIIHIMVLGGIIIPNPWWSRFFNHQPDRVFSENIVNPWCIGLKSQNPQCYMMPFEKKGPQKRVPMFDTHLIARRYEYVGKSHHIPMFGGKITQRSHHQVTIFAH